MICESRFTGIIQGKMTNTIKRDNHSRDKREKKKKKMIEFDKQMQSGYADLDVNLREAVKTWYKLFIGIKKYMEENNLSTFREFDKTFKGRQFVENWIQDFDDAFHNILMVCNSQNKEIYGKQRIELLKYIMEIKEPTNLTYLNSMRALAATYYILDDCKKGEKIYLDLIKSKPDHVWGYIGYSDEYWLGNPKYHDYTKAESILNSALDKKDLEDIEVVVERLEDLQALMKKTSQA